MAHTPQPGASTDNLVADPFTDGNRNASHLHFQEPRRSAYSLTDPGAADDGASYYGAPTQEDDDDELEKQPLAKGEVFTGGFYPPGCAVFIVYPRFKSKSDDTTSIQRDQPR